MNPLALFILVDQVGASAAVTSAMAGLSWLAITGDNRASASGVSHYEAIAHSGLCRFTHLKRDARGEHFERRMGVATAKQHWAVSR